MFFKGVLILGKPEAGARSTLELPVIERSRAPVSLIRACLQAGLLPRGQDRPGQLASYKQELFIT
jgi:hypothetical protein